jgi:glucose/arabinose dehydrogenase
MRRIVLFVALGLIAAACGSEDDLPFVVTTAATPTPATQEPPPPPSPGELAGLRLTLVAEGFEEPAAMATPPGDDRLFVVERFGTIRLVADGIPSSEPSLDVSGDLTSGGEKGLTGLAFHPDFGTNGRVFVMHNDGSGDSRVVEYSMRADDPDLFDEASAQLILLAEQDGFFHQGGHIGFGPDGYLWVTLGDGGAFAGDNARADPFGHGQNPFSLHSAVLRLDVDSDAPYAIPPDNPFADGRDGAPEVWAFGLRNPWRVWVDPVTDHVFITDVGQWAWEEVNVTTLDQSGRNYGWPILEGESCFEAETCDDSGLTGPTVSYDHSLGCAAVIGGPVYRGRAIPELHGSYFYGDHCVGWIRTLRFEDGAVTEEVDWTDQLGAVPDLMSFGVDRHGEAYVVQRSGEIYRIDPVRG